MGGEYKLELAEYVQWTEMYSEQKCTEVYSEQKYC